MEMTPSENVPKEIPWKGIGLKPVVSQVYKGIIVLEGFSKETGDVLYKETSLVYATEMSMLLDKIVQTAVTIRNHVFDWSITNLSSVYSPENDDWHMTIIHPELLDHLEPSNYFETWPFPSRCKDTKNEGQIMSFSDVVRFAVLVRHTGISEVANKLLLAKPERSNISGDPRFPLHGIDDATSFQQMTVHGFIGAELKAMLTVAYNENRLVRWKIVKQPKKYKAEKISWLGKIKKLYEELLKVPPSVYP